MSWLLGIVSWVLGRLFGKPSEPSAEAVAAADAASAKAKGAIDEQTIQDAMAANDAARRVPLDSGSLREPDPDSRD